MDQGQNDGICGGLGQRQVEIQVGLDEGVGIRSRLVHYRNLLPHGVQVFFLCTCRGERGDLWFQDLTHFGKECETFISGSHHAVKRLADGVEVPSVMKVCQPRVRLH